MLTSAFREGNTRKIVLTEDYSADASRSFLHERSALPACLLVRVHRSVPWPGPPTGTRQKRFTAAGLPIPRVPLGAA